MPGLLKDASKEQYSKYSKAALPWGEDMVTDRRLITGQNPKSARAVAEAITRVLGI